MLCSATKTGPLAILALVTTCAGVFVACDKSSDSSSTTVTTSAVYDAGVVTAPPDNGNLSEPAMAARPSDPNAVPTPARDVPRYGAPGSPLPRAVAPDSPANGVYGSPAGSMNAPYGSSMNNPTAPAGNGVGSVNDGNSAGSMNGTRPMNMPGSSASPYRSSNGATDAPNRVPSPPNAVP